MVARQDILLDAYTGKGIAVQFEGGVFLTVQL